MSLYELRQKIQKQKERLYQAGKEADDNLDTMENHAMCRGEIEVDTILKELDAEILVLESRKKELEKEREMGNSNLDEAHGRIDELIIVLGEKE